MTTKEELLIREFEKLKFDLIKRHRELGMEASGRWINSLEVVQERLNVKLLGANYTTYLVNGRGPTTGGPSEPPLIERIKQWVQDKGIARGQQATGIAWAITKTIHKLGTRAYRNNPRGTDLVESVITPQRIQSIIDKVGQEVIIEATGFMRNITREFKEIA